MLNKAIQLQKFLVTHNILAKLLAIKVAIKELRSSRRRQNKTLSATKALKSEF